MFTLKYFQNKNQINSFTNKKKLKIITIDEIHISTY